MSDADVEAASVDESEAALDVVEADEVVEADDPAEAIAAGSGERAVAVTEYLVKALTDEPDAVSVKSNVSDGTLRIDVEVAPGDVGRVIGKRGKVAGSVRSLVRSAAHLDGLRAEVEFD